MFKFVFLPFLSVSLALLGSVSFATTEKLEKTAKLVSEDTANNFLRQMSSKLINNSNFEHLQARVGIQNKEQTAEILAVYGLQKSADRFVFNQTSTSNVPPDCATGGANGCLMWVVPKGFEFKVETR